MHWRSVLASVLAAVLAGGAEAQVSGSVSLLSDYRFRGVSFSEGDPGAQIELNYDAKGGPYVGVFGSSVKFRGYPTLNRLVLPYVGYARRLGPDFSVDASLTYAHFAADSDFDYAEAHAGVTVRALNVQIAFAPHYLGQRGATYLEVNGGTELFPSLRILAHGGILHATLAYAGGTVTQADGRIGLRLEFGTFSVQLSRVAVSRVSAIYPGGPSGDRSAWVVQATRVF